MQPLKDEGAMNIIHLGGDKFRATGFGDLTAQELFKTMSQAPSAYLNQKELNHHPKMEKLFGKRIGTIRAMTFIADNFWHDGNMLADIDEKTGRIRRVITGTGPQMKTLDHHPETKKESPTSSCQCGMRS